MNVQSSPDDKISMMNEDIFDNGHNDPELEINEYLEDDCLKSEQLYVIDFGLATFFVDP